MIKIIDPQIQEAQKQKSMNKKYEDNYTSIHHNQITQKKTVIKGTCEKQLEKKRHTTWKNSIKGDRKFLLLFLSETK